MGFRNGNLGYPPDLLDTRSIVRKGDFALLTPDGLVRNVMPGFEGCDVTILASPKLGATFVDYLVTMPAGGGNKAGFGGDGVESFLCVLEGALRVRAGNEEHALGKGGYVYCPPDRKLCWESEEFSEFFLYKRRYSPAPGLELPDAVVGNLSTAPTYAFEDMENATLTDLLPKDDPRYDMNFHVLSFAPGASHGYIETHVQEHGAYVLSGEGMYRLDELWAPVKKGDYMFMGAYCPQACYAVGRERFSYLYSKDCNRDEAI